MAIELTIPARAHELGLKSAKFYPPTRDPARISLEANDGTKYSISFLKNRTPFTCDSQGKVLLAEEENNLKQAVLVAFRENLGKGIHRQFETNARALELSIQ
ncbi:hypothetical protein HY994_02215 [Candidatus Micrarchaeota archaeon]|nr:hypothetical protein [Candidatus Micrarchaeota archaeon]